MSARVAAPSGRFVWDTHAHARTDAHTYTRTRTGGLRGASRRAARPPVPDTASDALGYPVGEPAVAPRARYVCVCVCVCICVCISVLVCVGACARAHDYMCECISLQFHQMIRLLNPKYKHYIFQLGTGKCVNVLNLHLHQVSSSVSPIVFFVVHWTIQPIISQS